LRHDVIGAAAAAAIELGGQPSSVEGQVPGANTPHVARKLCHLATGKQPRHEVLLSEGRGHGKLWQLCHGKAHPGCRWRVAGLLLLLRGGGEEQWELLCHQPAAVQDLANGSCEACGW
jgi:hypothetical protein